MALRCAVNALLAPVLSVVFLLAACFVVLQDRTFPMPQIIADQTRAHIADVGAQVEFDRMALGLQNGFDLRAILQGVRVNLDESSPALEMSSIDFTLDGMALAQGEMRPTSAVIDGGLVRINRLENGEFDLGFGAGAPALRQALSLDALLDEMVQVFATTPLERLGTLRVTGASVLYTDKRSNQSWTFDGGVISIARSPDVGAFQMRVDLALLTGQGDIATLAVSYSNARLENAMLSADFDGVEAKDLASQIPALTWLSAVDAPISGSLRDNLSKGDQTPLSARLDFGAGRITIPAAPEPIEFTRAKTYMRFDETRRRLDFDTFEFHSNVIDVEGTASAVRQGDQFLVNITSQNVTIKENAYLDGDLQLNALGMDARISLDPMEIELGQAYAQTDTLRVEGRGRIVSTPGGWLRRLDLTTDSLSPQIALDHWPKAILKNPRKWVERNVLSGVVVNPTLVLRQLGDGKIKGHMTLSFKDTAFFGPKTMPPITGASGTVTVMNDTFDAQLSTGVMDFAQDGQIDLAGTRLHMDDLTLKPAIGQFDVAMNGPLSAALSGLDHKPFEVFSKLGRDYHIATGHMEGTVATTIPLKDGIRIADVDYLASAQVFDVRSDVLVRDRVAAAQVMQVMATPEAVTIDGMATLDGVPADIFWQRFEGEPGSQLHATFSATADRLAAFGIELPPGSFKGQANGQLTLDVPAEGAPKFTVTSDLVGAKLAIPEIGWYKSARQKGALQVEGLLTTPVTVSRLSLNAPGLSAEGDITLSNDRLDQISLTKVSVGGWLSGAVTLVNQGPNMPPAITIDGGRLDLRNTPFEGQNSSSMVPLTGRLSRVILADGLALHNVRAAFDGGKAGGGRFSGRINGGAAIEGTISRKGQSTIITMTSDDAGGAMRDAGILRQAHGGDLQLTLRSQADGSWRGSAKVLETRIQDAPVLANILSAVSVVGIIEQLDGKGLMMGEIRADFALQDKRVTLYSASAVGPSLGLSLDGYINTAENSFDLQGVVSPLYLVNSIGAVLTRRGEGLLGFNFTLKGQMDKPRVGVNPLSILTPGMFREIFRRPVPEKP